MRLFQISDTDEARIEAWLKDLEPRIIEIQKETLPDKMGSLANYKMVTEDGTRPYYGAIGGGINFQFTPTRIGTIIKVTEAITKETLDITDYDNF